MKKEYRTTVRARVARHVVLTLLISTIIVTVINLIYMSRRITQGQSNELSITTDLCASKVDTWANQLRGITIDIADTFEARGELKESDVKAVLNQIAETQSDLIFVYLATEDGKMYMARGVHLQEELILAREYGISRQKKQAKLFLLILILVPPAQILCFPQLQHLFISMEKLPALLA